MATVQSLTAEKIQELMAGWDGVELSQEQINSLISQLLTSQAMLDLLMEQFQNITLPQLLQDLNANDILLADLNENTLPGLQQALDDAEAQILNLQTVTLPGIQQDLINEIEGSAARPKVYHQADEPTNPDIDDRDLLFGDTWFDEDDGNKQYMWDGLAWTASLVGDIPDFSLTVRKFLSTTHHIY